MDESSFCEFGRDRIARSVGMLTKIGLNQFYIIQIVLNHLFHIVLQSAKLSFHLSFHLLPDFPSK